MRALALVGMVPFLALAGACTKEQPAPRPSAAVAAAVAAAAVEQPDWAAVSPDGKTSVEQYRRESPPCETRCVRAEQVEPLWSVWACLGERRHVRLVSDDGEWFAVVDPAVPAEGNGAQKLGAVALYRRGERVRRFTLADLFQDPGALHLEDGRYYWLAETPSGYKVELQEKALALTLSGGRALAIPFDAAVAVPQIRRAARAAQ